MLPESMDGTNFREEKAANIVEFGEENVTGEFTKETIVEFGGNSTGDGEGETAGKASASPSGGDGVLSPAGGDCGQFPSHGDGGWSPAGGDDGWFSEGDDGGWFPTEGEKRRKAVENSESESREERTERIKEKVFQNCSPAPRYFTNDS